MAHTRDLRLVLPLRITFQERPDVGGPSAGLGYALAIIDMLDTGDGARSRAIAATGTIAEDGAVGPVGGVHAKAIAEGLPVSRDRSGAQSGRIGCDDDANTSPMPHRQASPAEQPVE